MNSMQILVYLALCSTMVVIAASSNDASPCIVRYKKQDLPPLFTMNGTELKTYRRHIQISAGNHSECMINLTKHVDDFNLSATPAVEYFAFVCVAPVRVHVQPYTGLSHSHLVMYIMIFQCAISIKDLNEIGEVGTIRVLSLLSNVLVKSEPDNEIQCSNLRGLASLTHTYQNDGRYNSSFDDFFTCTPVYETLAEVIFSGLEWSSLPYILVQKFPNLQSLDIPSNKFTEPPSIFPWTNHAFSLPDNLSRTNYFQTTYAVLDNINIPNDIFRRTYRLDDNLLRNLSGFSFQGYLHYISLERNRIFEIGEDTFTNVTGLQRISLRENEISSLPCTVFKSVNDELANLDLSKNKLRALCDGVFDGLVNLKRLNLANNSLKALGEGLFRSLISLQVLHLEFNDFHVLNPLAFPLKSTKLTHIVLSNNPLNYIPEFIFWIRSLLKVDLERTNITLHNFTYFLDTMDEGNLEESIILGSSYIDFEEKKKHVQENPRKIDLSNSRITDINIESNVSKVVEYHLMLLLTHFQFMLKGNPLYCDCNILPISRFIKKLLLNGTVPESRFSDWICSSPIEHTGRPLLDVKPDETYCRIDIEYCPTECDCFQRVTNEHVIVDCRGRNVSKIHKHLPDRILELWYSDNVITKLSANPNFNKAVWIDVSDNQIDDIDPLVPSQLVNTKLLFLQGNLLGSLPPGFEELTFTQIRLIPNPLSCDCHTRWMKQWFIRHVKAIGDLSEIICFVNNEDGKTFINVPDEKFVCAVSNEVDNRKHTITVAIVSTLTAVIAMLVVLMIYAFRQDCKVLMFIYFGVHPFDKDSDDRTEPIDCIVMHSGQQTTWVMDNIVELLENANSAYRICDMARDFVVGLSFQENLTHTVKHSKRILFVLTNDWDCNSDDFILSWNIAKEKIKDTRSNFGIVVTHEVSKEQIKDKDLIRFLNRKRNVDTKERLFTQKMLYYMPTVAHSSIQDDPSRFGKVAYDNHVTTSEIKDNSSEAGKAHGDKYDSEICHTFISYCDDDIDYVTKQLQPLLEEQGFQLCIPDRDFIAGESKEANILHTIQSCERTILILSRRYMLDEWSLFTFRQAYDKTLRQKDNHLIVILLETLSDDIIDEEVKHYLNQYITLHVDDQWFQQKLFNALPVLQGKDYLHTSPLHFKSRKEEPHTTDKIVLHIQ